jgi:hypothetical protein
VLFRGGFKWDTLVGGKEPALRAKVLAAASGKKK